MHAFKFLSLSIVVSLLAFVQGAVSQETEPVPLGGQCGTIAGTLPCAYPGKCCYIHPDDGVCKLKCPKSSY